MDADRYAALLAPGVREGPLVRVLPRPDELDLQAHWFAGDFGREFQTLDGREVRIVQFGVWNREAGPDFAEVALSFDGGEPVRGSMELDFEARDWERHGHDVNPAYEDVLLHVFFANGSTDFFTRTARHRLVPQLRLDLDSRQTRENMQIPEAKPGRCVAPLQVLPEETVREVLLGAARFRLQRKTAALARLVEVHGVDEALFQSLATALGYKSNKLPFTLLAQRLPLRLLQRSRDELEPLLFGVSGFLSNIEPTTCDQPTRTYLRSLWERWWARRSEMQRLTLKLEQWNCGGQRPANHPQRRLAALAQCVRHWPKLRSLRDSGEPKAVRDFFGQLQDPYWDYHYTLTSAPSKRPMALVGETRVVDLLANVFIPFAIADNPRLVDTFAALRAPLSNRRVETAATRLFGTDASRREWLRSVAIQQGLLQVYEDFCLRDASDCAHCRFPEQLTKW
ncbi:DUF2851 family protein [Verrucomicrobiota bacterium sgz303538]